MKPPSVRHAVRNKSDVIPAPTLRKEDGPRKKRPPSKLGFDSAHTHNGRERESFRPRHNNPSVFAFRVRDDGFPVQKEKGFQREGRSGIRHVEGTRWLGFRVRVWILQGGRE